MALSEATLKKLSKDKIINLALDYQSQFDSALARTRNELLRNEKLGCDLSVPWQVNSVLRERVTNLERQCWSNSQCSRREYLELTGIPETNNINTLESTVLKSFEKLEVKVDPSNVEDCYWISSKNGLKRVIVKISKREDASKICSSKKKLKDMDLTSIGINTPVYINDSLYTYYQMLWRKCKSLRTSKLLHSFWETNGSIRLRTVENGRTSVIIHLGYLEGLFPGNELLPDKVYVLAFHVSPMRFFPWFRFCWF